jgi:hypothetical protein
MQRYDWDHIDPNYPEDCDRPYQMVCGLTNEFNLIERDRSLNSSKSNRFLPWRVAEGEIGSVPINPGDLCQFLNRATGEWVLEEFMGDWWFSQTRDLCGAYAAGKINGLTTFTNKTGMWGLSPERRAEILKKGGLTTGQKNAQTGRMREVQKLRPREDLVAQGKKIGLKAKESGQILEAQKKANKTKFICLVTGKVTTSGPLAQWQRKRGIDTSLKIKFETFTFLIKSLCLTTHSKTAKKW